MPSYLFVLCSLSVAGSIQATHSEEVILIQNLNKFYCFDHNLILIESATILDRFVYVSETLTVPQTLFVIDDIAGGVDTKSIRRSKNTLVIIGFTSTDFERNLIFLKKIKDLQRVDIELKIGLFFTKVLANDYATRLFEWCWQKSLIHIFIGYPTQKHIDDETHSLTVFTFNPFGTFELIDLTDSMPSVENFFPKMCYNLRQHPVRIAVHNDIYTFIYSKENPKFGGADGKLWQTIFRVVNASYFMVKFLAITDGNDIQDMATSGQIDVGPQTYLLSEGKPIYLYPIYMDKVVIVVPAAKPYYEFTAYLQTFFDDTLFALSFLTIPIVITALTIVRYVKRKRILLFQSAADVVNLFVYDNLMVDYRNLHRVETFIILPLTLTGFVLINVLLSILTSYLTRPMDQPEINTFNEIERSPLTLLVPTKKNMDQLADLIKHTFHMDWTHKMASTEDVHGFFQQILSFNTSICFVYFGSKINNLLRHQKRLNIRGYRIPTQTIQATVFGYVVPEDYPLKECFNEIIQWIMNAGLYWKWIDESYDEFIEMGYFADSHVNDSERGGEKYYVPIFIVYGWIGSVVVFVMEIVWKKIKSKNNSLK